MAGREAEGPIGEMPQKATSNRIRDERGYQMMTPERRRHPRNPHVEAHSKLQKMMQFFVSPPGRGRSKTVLSAQGGIMSVNREKDRSTGSNQCDKLPMADIEQVNATSSMMSTSQCD